MAQRIEIVSTIIDTRVDVYTFDVQLDANQLQTVANLLTNPVIQKAYINQAYQPASFSWAIEIGFLPGVTDNVANTTKQIIEDTLHIILSQKEGIYTAQLLFIDDAISQEAVQRIANDLFNPLIQRVQIKSYDEFVANKGMDIVVPKVVLSTHPTADVIDILNANDEELIKIGKEGIENSDGLSAGQAGTRRGPLALDLSYFKAIQAYFKKLGRNPTDIELETLAQTWSEHCKHTIFASAIDEYEAGLYRTFIKGATKKIRQAKGNKDFCVSVFTDNSGAIVFDDQYLITDKVETHNSPSALDPFGGAVTGIVGVNRDALGFGLGAKPIINCYGFCLANPSDTTPLYLDKELTQSMLPPRRIMEGVVAGINAGGNQSGIPTPQGFLYFDERYKGKPLVFAGTVGFIPKTSAGRPAYKKQAKPGDYIVMIGGRVGQDGIHGATFSSEALTAGSPATAVQIGDPITQKRFSDAIEKEARDLGLYNSITDNGAGGLSSSVGEMAKESGGCVVQLENVPLKYPGLAPWQIWISESQERMTLAVPKDKWEALADLMKRRAVEATVIGEFTSSGKCVVQYHDQTVLDLDLEFLHEGLPSKTLHTISVQEKHSDPALPTNEDLTNTLKQMLGRLNIASFAFISQQYDHEVQGGAVLKPLQGRGRINGDASVIRPVLDSNRAVILSQGVNPTYSDINTYHMAACAIDTAIRNVVAAGGNLDYLALLDNFCWCNSNDQKRLGQLKAAALACYDYAVAYGTPFISGKDSMFNDFKGFDEQGNPLFISIPPTLLISAIGVISDATRVVSLDAKQPGDLVYLLGETYDELGASEYYAMLGSTGNQVPQVDAQRNQRLYRTVTKAITEELIASVQSVHHGGLAVALAKTAIGGKLGMKLSLANVHGKVSSDLKALYSESQGRMVVTVALPQQTQFEKLFAGQAVALLGVVTDDVNFVVTGKSGKSIINVGIEELLQSYHSTFKNY